MFKEDLSPPIIKRQKLPLKLVPIFVTKLALIDSLEENAYAFHEGLFRVVLEEDEIILSDFIKEYISEVGEEIFISYKDYEILKEETTKELTRLTRSLSIGDIGRNSLKQTNLLTFQMDSLYADPFNNTLLNNQFQGAQNLTNVLLNTDSLDKTLYQKFDKLDHHYILKQPMVSSIMLLAFLKEIKTFSDRENESLFLTSYFKDIGMSFLSREVWNSSNLDEFNQSALSNHAENSLKILEGRIPLNKKYLNIIRNHNHLNAKVNNNISDEEEIIYGAETVIVNAIDVLVAMINSRPYRSSYSPFKALEFLKILMADDYPQEYKAIVKFVLKFLQK